jgi:hypothetical protein
MNFEIISLSSNIGGTGCGITDSLKLYNKFYRNTNEFFDYILTSFKSINEILKGKPIEFENKCDENGHINFKNFDFLIEIHSIKNMDDKTYLEKIKQNETIVEGFYSIENYPEIIDKLKEKYNRKLERFMNLLKNSNKIYFVRYCDNFNESIENDIEEFFDLIKKLNINLDVKLILFTLDKNLVFPNSFLLKHKNIFTINLCSDYKLNNGGEKYERLIEIFKPMVKFIDDVENSINNLNKNAVVILTRGYDDVNKYLSLINRNKGISKNLINKMIDIIIFHEGNITDLQQDYIKNETPDLKIIFTDVSEFAFIKEKEDIPFYRAFDKEINPPKGYRHMCHFWFVDFLKYCENYDYILRIDEDCFIDFNVDEIFKMIQDKFLIAGRVEDDHPPVVYGLNNFTLRFLRNNNFNNLKPRKVNGPYTNIFALNLKKVRENELVLKYIDEIDKSNNIYIYRWGDLPLWGEVIYYMQKPEDYIMTSKIKYFHGSLKSYVNGSSNLIKDMVTAVYKDDIKKYEKQDEENMRKHIQFLKKRNQAILNKIKLLNIKRQSLQKKKDRFQLL